MSIQNKAFEMLENFNPLESSDITFWEKNENPILMGRIDSFGSFNHDTFGHQETAILATKDNQKISVILNSYLRNGFNFQNAEIGDYARVDFLGVEKPAKGMSHNRFKLKIIKANSIN